MNKICKITMDSITKTQFEQIVSIEKECGLEPYTPEMLECCINELQTFACFKEDTIIGFITVNPVSSKYFGNSLYIVNINVQLQHRRQGIGERLMNEAMRAFPLCKQIILDVDRKNSGAIALYRKMGFYNTDIPSCNGDTDMVMVKDRG